MTNLEVISELFQGLLAQACLSALLATVVVFAAVKILKSTRAAFSGLWRKSRMGLVAVAIFSVAMGLWADKAGGDYVIVELCNYANAGMWNSGIAVRKVEKTP